MPTPVLNKDFADFLAQAPELAKSFFQVLWAWNDHQVKLEHKAGPSDGPPEGFKAGQTHELTTQTLTQSDLDQLNSAHASEAARAKFESNLLSFALAVVKFI